MTSVVSQPRGRVAAAGAGATVMPVLLALSAAHLLNDTLQSLLPAIYPLLKRNYALTFAQVGMITLTFQATASLLQPAVGFLTDRRPQPYSLPIGMGVSLAGLVLLARAETYGGILTAAALVGVGSSIFHPEASRMAKAASGGRTGLAQSVFQVGGNFGSSLGPLLAAVIIVPRGQRSLVWFTGLAVLGILVLARVGRWYAGQSVRPPPGGLSREGSGLPRGQVAAALGVLLILVFSKYFYLASLTNYYPFYLIQRFQLSVPAAETCLGVFLLAVAAGTIAGGPLGDRFGRKYVISGSILGVAPFTLLLPHVGLAGTIALSVVIGLILASAFSAILVYAQELLPGHVGAIAGLFFGFAFGMAGIASAVLGRLADRSGIVSVFRLCGSLPLLGVLAVYLPNLTGPERRAARK